MKDGSLGAFLSDNYMASNRILIWICSSLTSLFGDNSEEVELSTHPNSPGALWDKGTCERWLRERGLMNDDCAAMRIKDLRNHIAATMTNNIYIPLLEHLDGASYEDIINMLIAHHGLTSRAMISDYNLSSEASIIESLESYVKLYLSYVLEVDRKNNYNSKKQHCVFVTSPVYLDLLNLSRQMKAMGPLTSFWEG